jgi:hypothetical protein
MAPGKPVVVIVGASFSGITALSYLVPHVRVVLVDPKDYFEYSPGIPVCFTGSRVDRIVSPLSQFYEKYGSFVNGFFSFVSLETKTILVESSPGEVTEIHYDALLLCCGLPYSSPIRSLTLSLTQRKQELLTFSTALKKKKILAILGGGLIGVELAAELCSDNPSSPSSPSSELSRTLVIFTSDERLLPTLPISAGNKAQKWLTKKGVQIHFSSKISSITTTATIPPFTNSESSNPVYRLETVTGEVHTVDFVINCTGILSLLPDDTDQRQKQAPPTSSQSTEHSTHFLPFSALKTSRGTIAVDSFLRPVQGPLAAGEGIFVCGDLADIWSSSSSPLPWLSSNFPLPHWAKQLGTEIKSGFIAEAQAEIAAQNILLFCQSLSLSHTTSSSSPSSLTLHHYPSSKFLTPTAPLIACVTLGRSTALPYPSPLISCRTDQCHPRLQQYRGRRPWWAPWVSLQQNETPHRDLQDCGAETPHLGSVSPTLATAHPHLPSNRQTLLEGSRYCGHSLSPPLDWLCLSQTQVQTLVVITAPHLSLVSSRDTD